MLVEPPQEFGNRVKNPIVSVIVPVGPSVGQMDNLQKWIPECPTELELILVVDEYGDSTYELLQQFLVIAQNKAHVQLLHGHFGGPGYARNQGLKVARGKWVVFWDADDYPNVSAAVNVLSAVEGEPDLIVCGYEVISGKSRKRYHTKTLRSLAFNPGLWRIFFSKNLLGNFEFPNFRLGEDQVFLSNAVSMSNNIEFSDTCIYSYFTSQSNQLTGGTDHAPQLLEAADQIRKLNSKGMVNQIMEFRLRTTYIKRSIRAGHFSILKFDWARYITLAFRLFTNIGKE